MRRVINLVFYAHLILPFTIGATSTERAVLAVRAHAQTELKEKVERAILIQLAAAAKQHGKPKRVLEEELYSRYPRPAVFEEVIHRLEEQHGIDPEQALKNSSQIKEVVRQVVADLLATEGSASQKPIIDSGYLFRPVLQDNLIFLSFAEYLTLIKSSAEKALSSLEPTQRQNFAKKYPLEVLVEYVTSHVSYQFLQASQERAFELFIASGKFRSSLDSWVRQIISTLHQRAGKVQERPYYPNRQGHNAIHTALLRGGFEKPILSMRFEEGEFWRAVLPKLEPAMRKFAPKEAPFQVITSFVHKEFTPRFLFTECFLEALKWVLLNRRFDLNSTTAFAERVAYSFLTRLALYDPIFKPKLKPSLPESALSKPSTKKKEPKKRTVDRDKFIGRVLRDLPTALSRLLPRYGLTRIEFWLYFSESDFLEAAGTLLGKWESIPLGDFTGTFEAVELCERALRTMLERLVHSKKIPFPEEWREELAKGAIDRHALYHRLSKAKRETLHSLWDIAPVTELQRRAFQVYFVEMSPLRIGYTAQNRNAFRATALDAFDIVIGFHDWLLLAPSLVGSGQKNQARLFQLKALLEQIAFSYRIPAGGLPLNRAIALLESKYKKSGERLSPSQWEEAIESSARQALSEHIQLELFYNPFDSRGGGHKVATALLIKPMDLHFTDLQWKTVLRELESYVQEISTQFGLASKIFLRQAHTQEAQRGLFSPLEFIAAVRDEQMLWEKRRLGRSMPLWGAPDPESFNYYEPEVRLIVKNAILRLYGRKFQELGGSLPQDWQLRLANNTLSRGAILAMLPSGDFDQVLMAWALKELVRGRTIKSSHGDVIRTRANRFRDLFIHNIGTEMAGLQRLYALYSEQPNIRVFDNDFESFMQVWVELHSKKHYFANFSPRPGKDTDYLLLWARLQLEMDKRIKEIEEVFVLDANRPFIAFGEFEALVDSTYSASSGLTENTRQLQRRAELASRNFINLHRPEALSFASGEPSSGGMFQRIILPSDCPLSFLDLVSAFQGLETLVEERSSAFGLTSKEFWDKDGGRFNRQDVLNTVLSILADWRARLLRHAEGEKQLKWLARVAVDRLLAILWFSKHRSSPQSWMENWQSELATGRTDYYALMLRMSPSHIGAHAGALFDPQTTKEAERLLDYYYYLGHPLHIARKYPGITHPIEALAEHVLKAHEEQCLANGTSSKTQPARLVLSGKRAEPKGYRSQIKLIFEQARIELQVEKVQKLSFDEVKALSLRISQGDDEAFKSLVLSNFSLVRSVSRRYLGFGLDELELFSAGVMGLLRAAENYDPERYTEFSTYATPCIESTIEDDLDRWHGPHSKKHWRWTAAAQSIAGKLGRRASTEEIEAELRQQNPGLTDTQLQAISFGVVAHRGARREAGEPDRAKTIADPDRGIAELEINEELSRRLALLSPRERFVIGILSNISYNRSLTFSEIELALGRSEQWAGERLSGDNIPNDLSEYFFSDPSIQRRSPITHFEIIERLTAIDPILDLMYRMRFNIALDPMNERNLKRLTGWPAMTIMALRVRALKAMYGNYDENQCRGLFLAEGA